MSPNKLARDDVQDKKAVALDHMDVQDNVEAIAGRNSASPDEPVAEPGGVHGTVTPNGITLVAAHVVPRCCDEFGSARCIRRGDGRHG